MFGDPREDAILIWQHCACSGKINRSSQRTPMRLPLIPPSELTPQQKSLYDEMRKGIASNFNAIKVERDDGALKAALRITTRLAGRWDMAQT
jgi:predicted exporter